MLRALLTVAVLCAPVADNPLTCLLEKSELVVSGEIIEPPTVWNSEGGVNNYDFRLRVSKTLKGEPEADEIEVVFTRIERDGEQLPYLKKGWRVILFLRHGDKLKGERDKWLKADSWLALQPYNRALEKSLQSLAER